MRIIKDLNYMNTQEIEMLEKTYDPKNFEEKIYSAWEEKGCFKTNMNKNK